jgi:hypothetical protein
MRHNLRDDMTVVRGCANQIRGSVNGDVADMSSTIVRKADGSLTISEKAVEIDRMLEHESDPEEIDIEPSSSDGSSRWPTGIRMRRSK